MLWERKKNSIPFSSIYIFDETQIYIKNAKFCTEHQIK